MIKIYNTLSGNKEDFKPLKDKDVTFYLCGPTVYDEGHLGHGRSATAFDIIRRYLLYKNYNVLFVSNYTDIDDKMINRAKEKNISVKELADTVIPYYERDYAKLKILPADVTPKATEYIEQIIEIIKSLEEKDATYQLEDGVYFDISKFPLYGKLSGQKLDDLQMGARVEVNKAKRNPQDFALWKIEKPGEPSWDSPWGKGRPGWHIECSAMSMGILGNTIDIHAGGADLCFPHHECEIAQSETATGMKFTNYWIHNGFVNINEEKMSKSLGNFITLNVLLNKYSGAVIRYLYLQTHYRSPINFTDDLLEQSQMSLQRIHDFIRNLKHVSIEGEVSDEIKIIIDEADIKFENGMNNDFDTTEALAAIFQLIKKINILQSLNIKQADLILKFFKKIDEVFAVLIPEEQQISEELLKLIKKREEARNAKDWDLSDKLRDELKTKGILVEDTPEGTIWKKLD